MNRNNKKMECKIFVVEGAAKKKKIKIINMP